MWCPQCNRETASVPTRTGDGICCALCGESYFQEKPSDEAIREARDIIARWSSSDLLDRISTLPEIPPLPGSEEDQQVDSAAFPAETAENPVIPPISTAARSESSRKDSHDDSLSQQDDSGVIDRTEVELTATVGMPSEEVLEASELSSPAGSTAQIAKPGLLPPQGEKSSLNSNRAAPNEISSLKPSDGESTTENTAEIVKPPAESPKGQPKRKQQPRTSQPRVQRPRKQPVAVNDQGMKPMSRKFRVDTPGRSADIPAEETAKNSAGGQIQSNSQSGKRHRIDGAVQVADTLETGNSRSRTRGPSRRRYIDESHDSVAGPHFQVTAERRSNFTSITGQFLAYLGVLGLTVGTAMVIYGHFGGYSEYTPTGWLVTTVAQMMLFLGVINLVSGGMEQTNHDVSQRMEYLGSQLMRIEQVTEEALRGPKINARRYADPDADVEDSERAHAGVED